MRYDAKDGRLRGRAGIEQRRRRMVQGQGFCRPCRDGGRLTIATQVDHIVPLSEGGTDTDDNCQTICNACHAAKTASEAGSRRSSMTPAWMPKPPGPITLVYGPPCAGKTTHVAANAMPGDVVLDLDCIVQDLCGVHGHEVTDKDIWSAAIRLRNTRLAHLQPGQAAWVIATAATATERRWWSQHMGAALVRIDPGYRVCLARSQERTKPTADKVRQWYERDGQETNAKPVKQPIGLDGWPSA